MRSSGVTEFLSNPKFIVVMALLLILAFVQYKTTYGERRADTGRSYLGSEHHEQAMMQMIERIARQRLLQYPRMDDTTLARLVRDEIREQKMLNVDMYEGLIFSVVRRLRTDDQMPP
ncbi:hypothetical protein BH09MYX1_BH09MYX1_38690 [soil metagenome]